MALCVVLKPLCIAVLFFVAFASVTFSLDAVFKGRFQIRVLGMASPEHRALVNRRSNGNQGIFMKENTNQNLEDRSSKKFDDPSKNAFTVGRAQVSFGRQQRSGSISSLRMTTPSSSQNEVTVDESVTVVEGDKSSSPAGGVVRRIDDVIKPEIDNRNYRHIWLQNGLQVFLVSDPDADVASASINVHAGHFQDPAEFAGLAHFHEHMLFLGTEKFPDEGEYEAYLNAHGGFSNAYTSMEDTNLYFEVDSGALEGALERFSSFFQCPLFSESATDRELNAVDSENTNNLLEDKWRLYQLQKSTSDHKHPYHKFSTGNLGTLKKDGLRQALLNFHETYYTAPMMKLVILGQDDLDTMEKWAETYFSGVRSSDIPPRYDYPAPAYGLEQLGQRLLSVPIKDTRRLALAFPMPLYDTPETGLYTKPTVYLGHLIGHEGPGSLHALLNQKGWINGLSAGSAFKTDDFGMFKISLSLTEAGMENVEEIIDTVFEFLAMMKNQGPQKWVFDELRQMSEVAFRFKEWGDASSFTQKYSDLLSSYSPEDIFYGSYRLDDWKPELIQKFENLLTPENCQIQITSTTFKDQSADWDQEKWYGTQYKQILFTDEEKNRWGKAQGNCPNLRLPTPNEFIPDDFSLKCKQPENAAQSESLSPEEARELPPVVVREPISTESGDYDAFRVWHKMDSTFCVPKASLIMKLLCGRDGYYASPLAMTLVRLYVKMVKEELKEYAYDASVAGLRYGVTPEPEGLTLTVSGYSDKLPILANKLAQTFKVVLDKCRSINIEPNNEAEKKILGLFEKHKKELLKDYSNYEKETPYQRAMYYARLVLEAEAWHISEYSQALLSPVTTPANMVRVMENILSRVQIEAMAHGNIIADEALHLASVVKDGLQMNSLPLPDSELQEWRHVSLPKNREVVVELELPSPDEENSAVEVHYQLGVFDDSYKKDCLLDIINHIAYNSAFKALRTEEQLGYIVSTTIRKGGWPARVGGFSVIVQGPHHPPKYLDERVEAWLTRFRAEFQAMSEDDFSQNIQGLISQKLEKCTRLGEESSLLWSEIVAKDQTDFQRYQKEAAILKDISKEEAIAFFDRYISQTAEDRRKLSVQVYSSKMTDQMKDKASENEVSTEGPIILHDLTSIRKFKQSSSLYGKQIL